VQIEKGRREKRRKQLAGTQTERQVDFGLKTWLIFGDRKRRKKKKRTGKENLMKD
jgi:hypothetical protein